jgi:hypothetical protein
MRPRGYRDLRDRLRRLPERLWCLLAHRSMWKVWRIVDSRHGRIWVGYFCRICGKEHTG